MKPNLLLTTIAVCFAVSSCNSTKSTSGNDNVNSVEKLTEKVADGDVPYELAKNYFVKNTHKNEAVEELKITTQEQFDDIFGMATTMGEKGMPTKIDFSKQFVISVIGTVTNKATDFTIDGLLKDGSDITFKYTEKVGEEMSYSIQPSLIVIVYKSYDGNLISKKNRS